MYEIIPLLPKPQIVHFPGCMSLSSPTVSYVFPEGREIAAVCVLNNQVFVTRDGVADVSVYGEVSHKFHRTISMQNFGSSLWDLAASGCRNCLFVSDFRNNVVHRVELARTK